jgi:predicted hydrocarbon binding protein
MGVPMPREGNGPRTVVVPEWFFGVLGGRLFRDFGPNAAEHVLYEIGRDAGRAFARGEEHALGRTIHGEEAIRALVRKFGSEYGWADIALRELVVPEKFAVVEWRDGVGVPRGGFPAPVCHVGRGLLSGAAEICFGAPCDALETKCQAMGHDRCEVIVGMPDRIAQISEQLE